MTDRNSDKSHSEPSRRRAPRPPAIAIRGAREHNLKNVDLDIPRDQLVVFTGLSGSGKSSLAFDTIYAEGQRRYVESLSAYARQFLEMMQKPDVDQIDGLSPAISIEQKTTSRNPRSTVGTVTEIYDYMRLLWARVGVPYSPATGLPIESQTVSQMVDRIMALPEGTRLYLLAPSGARPQGRVPQGARRLSEKGIPARQDRRQILRDRRSAGARQEIHPRHRRRGRPHRGAAGHRRRALPIRWRPRSSSPTGWRWRSSPMRRLTASDAARRRRRPSSRQRSIRCRAPRLLGKIRLPGVRLHHSGNRAAAVLVQQSVRRLPEMRRPRRRAAYRRRPRHPRQGAHPAPAAPSRRGRNRRRPITCRRCSALGKHYKFTLDTKWKDLPKKTQEAILYGSGDTEIRFSYDDGARAYETKRPFEGVITNLERRFRETDSDWAREEIARYFTDVPCEACKGYRLKPEALVREGRRPAHRRSLRHVGQRRSCLVH